MQSDKFVIYLQKIKVMDYQIKLFRNGDRDAFKAIYNAWWGKVYHFARLWLKDDYEAEEVVQETFIKLWEIRERVDSDRNIDGLLFIITRNLVFNRKRRSLNEEVYRDMLAAADRQTEDPLRQIEADDIERYIDSLVMLLPPHQRETFILSRRDGLSNKEIAERMNISQRGVERNLYLAMRFIRKNLPLMLIFFRVPFHLS